MRPLRFAKYQAAGNDFVVVDDLEGTTPALDAETVSLLCDRWFGVGADGVIRVSVGVAAPFAFALTNADGTPAEMSGNGIRCVAAFLHAATQVDADALAVQTPAGVKQVTLDLADGLVRGATVAMGVPNFTKAAIPMRGPAWETFQRQPVQVGDLSFTATALSMGNPHLVLFVDDDPDRYDLEHLGPALEHHELFPERTNVEFARVGDDAIDVRVWERGVGETLACGTGACAVAVAANEAGLAPSRARVRFRGGTLTVERREDGEVLLGGPVTHVYDGVVDLDRLA